MNVAQVLVSGLITAAELGIIAIGLTMTFSILRFANFSHASMAVVGAYLAYFLNVTLGAPLLAAFVVAVLAMGLFGVAVDAAIFRIMRNTGDLTPMIGSLGLSLVIQVPRCRRSGGRSSFAIATGCGPAYPCWERTSQLHSLALFLSPQWRCSPFTRC